MQNRPTLNGERSAAQTHRRLRQRTAVMGVFSGRAGQLLDADQVAAATRYPRGVARSVIAELETDGWLERHQRPQGRAVWRRPSDGRVATAAPASAEQPSRERALAEPSTAATFFCRRCGRGVGAELPPEGWLRVQERQGAKERESSRLYVTRGLFCGLACLIAWAGDPDAKARTP